MAAEADELHRRPLDYNPKTRLTQTGLLMEGLGLKCVVESRTRDNFRMADHPGVNRIS